MLGVVELIDTKVEMLSLFFNSDPESKFLVGKKASESGDSYANILKAVIDSNLGYPNGPPAAFKRAAQLIKSSYTRFTPLDYELISMVHGGTRSVDREFSVIMLRATLNQYLKKIPEASLAQVLEKSERVLLDIECNNPQFAKEFSEPLNSVLAFIIVNSVEV